MAILSIEDAKKIGFSISEPIEVTRSSIYELLDQKMVELENMYANGLEITGPMTPTEIAKKINNEISDPELKEALLRYVSGYERHVEASAKKDIYGIDVSKSDNKEKVDKQEKPKVSKKEAEVKPKSSKPRRVEYEKKPESNSEAKPIKEETSRFKYLKMPSKELLDKYGGKKHEMLDGYLKMSEYMELIHLSTTNPNYELPKKVLDIRREINMGYYTQKGVEAKTLEAIDCLKKSMIKVPEFKEGLIEIDKEYEQLSAFKDLLAYTDSFEEKESEPERRTIEEEPKEEPYTEPESSVEEPPVETQEEEPELPTVYMEYARIVDEDLDKRRSYQEDIVDPNKTKEEVTEKSSVLYNSLLGEKPIDKKAFADKFDIAYKYTKLTTKMNELYSQLEEAKSSKDMIRYNALSKKFSDEYSKFSKFSNKKNENGVSYRDIAVEVSGKLQAIKLADELTDRSHKIFNMRDMGKNFSEKEQKKAYKEYQEYTEDYKRVASMKDEMQVLTQERRELVGRGRTVDARSKESRIRELNRSIKKLQRKMFIQAVSPFVGKTMVSDFEAQISEIPFLGRIGILDRDVKSLRTSRLIAPKIDLDKVDFIQSMFEDHGWDKESISKLKEQRELITGYESKSHDEDEFDR